MLKSFMVSQNPIFYLDRHNLLSIRHLQHYVFKWIGRVTLLQMPNVKLCQNILRVSFLKVARSNPNVLQNLVRKVSSERWGRGYDDSVPG